MKSVIPYMTWALVVGIIAGVAFSRSCGRDVPASEPDIRRDTVTVRDTIRPPIPEPQVRTVVRYDTVRLPARPVERPKATETTVAPDTVKTVENTAVLPITSAEYKTDDYKAVIEGYNPRLVSMELYPKTMIVSTTVTKYRHPTWAVTVGAGIGYGPKGAQPYVGVTVGYVLWSR